MKSRLKYTGVAIGLVTLFLLVTFQFVSENSWNSWNLPLSGKVIILDPGHGGPDGGASNSGVLEKDISLSVSNMIRDYLQEQGALVLMTREDDSDLAGDVQGYRARKREDLRQRVELINQSQADMYLSIHLNAFPSSQSHGAQTFYTLRYKENKELAKFIQAELQDNLENTKREAKAIDHVYVMKYAEKPGALVEIGFLSNTQERNLLVDANYQNKIAVSVYEGIMRFMTEEPIED